jgi:hypothetical protein
MYSEKEYRKAPEVYEETKWVTKTITILGYPARRQTLYNRINRKRTLPKDRSTLSIHQENESLRFYTVALSWKKMYHQ